MLTFASGVKTRLDWSPPHLPFSLFPLLPLNSLIVSSVHTEQWVPAACNLPWLNHLRKPSFLAEERSPLFNYHFENYILDGNPCKMHSAVIFLIVWTGVLELTLRSIIMSITYFPVRDERLYMCRGSQELGHPGGLEQDMKAPLYRAITSSLSGKPFMAKEQESIRSGSESLCHLMTLCNCDFFHFFIEL